MEPSSHAGANGAAAVDMSAINRLLKRWGYVRLDEYGLLLTPDGRIVATRPAVLDDGRGARVVGWRDGDLAGLELEPWRSAPKRAAPRPAAPKPAAPRPAASAPPIPAPVTASAPPSIPRPVVAPEPVAMAVLDAGPARRADADPPPPAAPAPPVASDPSVASDPVVIVPPISVDVPAEPAEDDEWDWEIALARARAAAAPLPRVPAPPPVMPAASSRWVAARALTDGDDDTPVNRTTNGAAPTRPHRSGATPSTVIPVPRLPAAADPAAVIRTMAPVYFPRATTGARPMPSRRHATRRP
jgi:hypothetical protein